MGCAGLLVFPLAIVVYLVALPFFAILWLLDRVLPTPSVGQQWEPERPPAEAPPEPHHL